MPDDDGGTAPPTFNPPASQDALDRLIGTRLAQERAKYADYDDLKGKAQKFDELDAQTKTELQKLQDALTERDAKLASLPGDVRKQAIRFASTATQKGFLDPEDALAFIDSDVDLSDNDAVTAALDALAERKPHLVRTPKKQVPTRPKPSGAADDDKSGEQFKGKERAAAALRQFRNT